MCMYFLIKHCVHFNGSSVIDRLITTASQKFAELLVISEISANFTSTFSRNVFLFYP